MVLAVAIGLMPMEGAACALRTPFDMTGIGAAELVVVGRVTGYTALESGFGAALVVIEVEETLKGLARGEVTFVWNGSLAQAPTERIASGRVLIGAMRGGRPGQSDRMPDARPDLPSIIQPYCGEVWMQPARPGTLRAAREALE